MPKKKRGRKRSKKSLPDRRINDESDEVLSSFLLDRTSSAIMPGRIFGDPPENFQVILAPPLIKQEDCDEDSKDISTTESFKPTSSISDGSGEGRDKITTLNFQNSKLYTTSSKENSFHPRPYFGYLKSHYNNHDGDCIDIKTMFRRYKEQTLQNSSAHLMSVTHPAPATPNDIHTGSFSLIAQQLDHNNSSVGFSNGQSTTFWTEPEDNIAPIFDTVFAKEDDTLKNCRRHKLMTEQGLVRGETSSYERDGTEHIQKKIKIDPDVCEISDKWYQFGDELEDIKSNENLNKCTYGENQCERSTFSDVANQPVLPMLQRLVSKSPNSQLDSSDDENDDFSRDSSRYLKVNTLDNFNIKECLNVLCYAPEAIDNIRSLNENKIKRESQVSSSTPTCFENVKAMCKKLWSDSHCFQNAPNKVVDSHSLVNSSAESINENLQVLMASNYPSTSKGESSTSASQNLIIGDERNYREEKLQSTLISNTLLKSTSSTSKTPVAQNNVNCLQSTYTRERSGENTHLPSKFELQKIMNSVQNFHFI